jgi:hypothetical protein
MVMDESGRAHSAGQESEPHLEWCRRSYALADGSTWHDPFDCQDDYRGPRAEDFAHVETLLAEGAPRFLWPYLYRALVDIAGPDWARHALVWTLRLDDFAHRAAFLTDTSASASPN